VICAGRRLVFSLRAPTGHRTPQSDNNPSTRLHRLIPNVFRSCFSIGLDTMKALAVASPPVDKFVYLIFPVMVLH